MKGNIEYLNLTKQEQRRFNRLFKKIKSLLNIYVYKCLFITLTFNDDILNKTKEETRKRYIKKYLNENSAIYIANKDKGKKGNREHYHAFIIVSTIKNIKEHLKPYQNKLDLTAYKYGKITAQRIGLKRLKNDNNFTLTALNLTKHFFKKTSDYKSIIQSRERPTDEEQLKRIIAKYKKEQEEDKQRALINNNDESALYDEIEDYNEYIRERNGKRNILDFFNIKLH